MTNPTPYHISDPFQIEEALDLDDARQAAKKITRQRRAIEQELDLARQRKATAQVELLKAERRAFLAARKEKGAGESEFLAKRDAYNEAGEFFSADAAVRTFEARLD